MPTAYAYIRVSTIDQATKGYSLDTQEQSAKRYFDLLSLNEKYKGLVYGGFYSEAGQSAYKVRFAERTEGSKLIEQLEPGDHIIFCRLDRAFRSLVDGVTQMEKWRDEGINVHFVDQFINMDTANGRFVANLLAAVAQWESDIKSERCREVARRKKNAKQPVNQKTPHGMKLAGRGKNKRYVMAPEERPCIRLMRIYRNVRGMSYDRISKVLDEIFAARENRKPYVSEFDKSKRRYTKGKVRAYCEQMDILMPNVKPSARRKIWNDFTRTIE